MKLTKEQVIEKIKNGEYLEDFPEWVDDKDVVLQAIKKDGWLLRYASDRLKDDKEVVLEAIKIYTSSLMYASERLRDDKELVLEVLEKDNGWTLMCASDRLKKELLPQVLKGFGYTASLNPIEIVKHDGDFLSLLTTEDRNNKEIVLEAVKQKNWVIEYASKEIQNKIGNNNPVEFLERWIKSEKQQEYLNQQIDKKEKSSKIKL